MKEDILWVPNLGNGEYKNPVLHADYSDPDVIRFGTSYYMTASSFHYTPGLPILRSKNLVDWELVNYALKEVPAERFASPRISEGVWAPAIREHDGKVYIFFGMPDEGIYEVHTDNPEGEWSEPRLIKEGKGLIDPCPYWDEEGNAYCVHAFAKSRIGFKSILAIFQFEKDGKAFDREDILLFDGHPEQYTIEGPKVHKRNGYYYIFAPAGGVTEGWQLVLRSKSLFGPYEYKKVLEQGKSPINGPHQGAWVEGENGEEYFLHFQDKGAYGRVVHLQPLVWHEDWPLMGSAAALAKAGNVSTDVENLPGEALTYAPMPSSIQSKDSVLIREELSLQASDDFSSGELGLQWQFFGNVKSIEKDIYEIMDSKLRLFARNSNKNMSYSLWDKVNYLSQKVLAPSYEVSVRLNLSDLKEQNAAGLAILGGEYASIRCRKEVDGMQLDFVKAAYLADEETLVSEVFTGNEITLGLRFYEKEKEFMGQFFYSSQGKETIDFAETFAMHKNTWTGARIGLYCIGRECTSASTRNEQEGMNPGAQVETAIGSAVFEDFRAIVAED